MSWACGNWVGSFAPVLCQTVDHYCERTSAAWYAEPVNALSNLAFLIAGWAAWRLWSGQRGREDGSLLPLMIALLPLIGIGSFAFHTIATRWAEWLDVLPIAAFMTVYLWYLMTEFLGWTPALKSMALACYFLSTLAIEASVPAAVLSGGALYLPSIVILSMFTLIAYNRADSRANALVPATGLFVAAFTFRTLDAPLCELVPVGSHFLWHLSNALLAYLLVRAAILSAGTAAVRAIRAEL